MALSDYAMTLKVTGQGQPQADLKYSLAWNKHPYLGYQGCSFRLRNDLEH